MSQLGSGGVGFILVLFHRLGIGVSLAAQELVVSLQVGYRTQCIYNSSESSSLRSDDAFAIFSSIYLERIGSLDTWHTS